MHQPPMLWPVVVERGQVLHAASIPHQDIVHLPGVRILKLRLEYAGRQLLNQWDGQVVLHASDGSAFSLADIETFLACERMRAHDRMQHIWLLRAERMILLPRTRTRPASCH